MKEGADKKWATNLAVDLKLKPSAGSVEFIESFTDSEKRWYSLKMCILIKVKVSAAILVLNRRVYYALQEIWHSPTMRVLSAYCGPLPFTKCVWNPDINVVKRRAYALLKEINFTVCKYGVS